MCIYTSTRSPCTHPECQLVLHIKRQNRTVCSADRLSKFSTLSQLDTPMSSGCEDEVGKVMRVQEEMEGIRAELEVIKGNQGRIIEMLRGLVGNGEGIGEGKGEGEVNDS